VGALIEKNGKFLLVREGLPNRPDYGKWNQPAGWLDLGEDPIMGARREVEEETGYEFTPAAILSITSLVREDVAEHFSSPPHALKIIFTGKINTDNPKKIHDDVTEVNWFSAEEIKVMSSKQLRDVDIKQLVDQYLMGIRYPLEIIKHVVQEK